MTITNWDQLPLTLRMQNIADLYDLNVTTVRRKVLSGDTSIPVPNFVRPYRWRREDVRRHYERHSVSQQRADIARRTFKAAS